ncbi:hypothetical protein [Magnetofaba australis]|nr:hypothetical protein [Magnetofaba australis]
MEIRWSRQSQGFHQATYPNRSHQLTVSLAWEESEGERVVEQVLPLGRVIVEESPGQEMKFLFGTDLAFWPDIQQKLDELGLEATRKEEILAQIAEVVPKPVAETTPRFRPRFDI